MILRVNKMLRVLARTLLGRAMGMALLGGGFWLLFIGFEESSVALGTLGGVMIPLGMWVMAFVARPQPRP